MTSYADFIATKSQSGNNDGFEPIWMPDFLFDFQRALVEWAVRKGRAALLEDCGMGKSPQELVWAENVVRHTNRPVLLATPIAVGKQMIREAEKFGIEAKRTRDGKHDGTPCIWVTNYEQLHKYNPDDFGGFVGDESSAIKDMKSERKKTVAEFTRRMRFRLLATATAAPNDYWELGTSSDVLGYLGSRDMLTTFFKQETTKDYLGWGRTKYRFRGHAEEPFWSWVCSWARSLRKPSDLGFDDSRFILPPLIEKNIIVDATTARPGMLFTLPAKDMHEERAERRYTVRERCGAAAKLANEHDGYSSIWCALNEEGDRLESLMDDCVQVKGSMPDDAKEEALQAFSDGQIKRIVIKPKIGAWGLNWQHCNNVVVLPTHSYESDYQLVRRSWRFGQTKPVTVTRIVCEGESGILDSLKRKQAQTVRMFESIVAHMRDSMHLVSQDYFSTEEVLPRWL